MDKREWFDIVARISSQSPTDIDADLSFATKRAKPGSSPNETDRAVRPPSSKLWASADSGVSYIGVRVDQTVKDPALLAMRLAASALERGVVPIILSSLPRSGMEPFGFRVERVGGTNKAAREAAEAEIAAFWNLAIIIDANDAVRLH